MKIDLPARSPVPAAACSVAAARTEPKPRSGWRSCYIPGVRALCGCSSRVCGCCDDQPSERCRCSQPRCLWLHKRWYHQYSKSSVAVYLLSTAEGVYTGNTTLLNGHRLIQDQTTGKLPDLHLFRKTQPANEPVTLPPLTVAFAILSPEVVASMLGKGAVSVCKNR